jgi:hypothetical protein
MSTTLIRLVYVAVFSSASLSLAASALVLPVAQAAKGKPAAKPAQAQAADDQCEPAIPAELIDLAEKSFVAVHFSFQKDTSEEAEEDAPAERWQPSRQDQYQSYIDRKMTLQVGGVVIAPGEILIPDVRVEPRHIKAIEVRTLDGKVLSARPGALLTRCDAATVLVDGPGADSLECVHFESPGELTLASFLQAVSVSKVEDQWRMGNAELEPTCALPDRKWIIFGGAGHGHGSSRFEMMFWAAGMHRAPLLIADGNGRPVGVSCAAGVDSRQVYGTWIGADVLACPRISLTDLESQRKSTRQKLLEAVHEVAVQFRQGRGPSSGGDMEGRYRMMSMMMRQLGNTEGEPDVAGRELTFFGVAVSKTQLLIPSVLDRQTAAQIDRIWIKLDAQHRLPARFVGAYKDFGAFMVELTDGELPVTVARTEQPPPRGAPFWVACARKKFAHKYLELEYARLTGVERGYADAYYWQADTPLNDGALLFGLGGELFGLQLHQRLEDEEQKRLAGAGRRNYMGDSDQSHIFLVKDLAGPLTDPMAHLDREIVVKNRLAALRRPWLGVEFVTLDPKIAEQMKISTPTKDGSVGLLINAVYNGSPAEKIGLKVGDILLRLQEQGKDEPIELKVVQGEGDTGRGDGWSPWGEGEDEARSVSGQEGPAERTWKNRDNFLTRLLDAIGTGKQVTVTYFSSDDPNQVRREAAFAVQTAPPDYSSARRWKNRKVGLTVKDLTYEVRNALTIKADGPGVVVAKVESGSPTSVARIWPNEIITHADGVPLKTAWQLQKAVAAAKAAGKDKIRLSILRLGKTRLADLKIDAYDKADDEGLDEDY